jgi:anti-sigma factor RsiW
MTCQDFHPLLNAYFDGELDLSNSLQIEHHLEECPGCPALYRKMATLRQEIVAANLDFGANADLSHLRSSIRRRVHRSEPWLQLWRRPWVVTAAAAALLLAAVLPFRMGSATNHTERELVDDHVRSMITGHLVDVPSSDHHTVKPWFEGKLSFSPPVPELADRGFTLAGGRLDVIAGQTAAALVYQRRKHIINLWITPPDKQVPTMVQTQINGFNLVHWQSGAFAYWAVSDLNAAELREFVELIRRDSSTH